MECTINYFHFQRLRMLLEGSLDVERTNGTYVSRINDTIVDFDLPIWYNLAKLGMIVEEENSNFEKSRYSITPIGKTIVAQYQVCGCDVTGEEIDILDSAYVSAGRLKNEIFYDMYDGICQQNCSFFPKKFPIETFESLLMRGFFNMISLNVYAPSQKAKALIPYLSGVIHH